MPSAQQGAVSAVRHNVFVFFLRGGKGEGEVN